MAAAAAAANAEAPAPAASEVGARAGPDAAVAAIPASAAVPAAAAASVIAGDAIAASSSSSSTTSLSSSSTSSNNNFAASPSFFRMVVRLQAKFHRLKARTQEKLRSKLLEQRRRDEAALAEKLKLGRAQRVRRSSAFLELPGMENASATEQQQQPPSTNANGNAVVAPTLPPLGLPPLTTSSPPPNNAGSPAFGTSTTAAAAGSPVSPSSRPGSRPMTPASNRGGSCSPQRSPRLPNKAADLLFGSKKHTDKRADVLGLSSGQMGMIDANPNAQKALTTMGVAAVTGATMHPLAAPATDTVVVPSEEVQGAPKQAPEAALPLRERDHNRTHSESLAAEAAGKLAAEAEAERIAKLESLRAAKQQAAREAREAAAAAAAASPRGVAALAATSGSQANGAIKSPAKGPVMNSKAQKLLLGSTGGTQTTGGAVKRPPGLPAVAGAAAADAASPNGSPRTGDDDVFSAAARPMSAAATNANAMSVNASPKVLAQLGVTAKQLEMFPNNQSRAFSKLGVDKPLQASMLTDANAQHVRHARADREAERAGLAAQEAARLELSALNHAPKHQSSTKVSALLLGGQDKKDKVLDKLGMSAKEINTFKEQPKAFQKLGVFDAPLSARAAQAQRNALAAQRANFAGVQQQQQQLQRQRIQQNGRLPPQHHQQQQRSLGSSQSVPTLPTAGGYGAGVNVGVSHASVAHTTTTAPHGRKLLPSLAGRTRVPSASPPPGPGGEGSSSNGSSKWGRVRGQMNNGAGIDHHYPPGPGATAAMARPSNGMSYSASLKSLSSSSTSSASPANLARAYGSSTVQAVHHSSSSSGLFNVVMAAKRVRTAGGTSKTVHVLSAAGSGVFGGSSGSGSVASIQSGKGVPASLGAGFALQGTSAPISPAAAKDAHGGRGSGDKYTPEKIAAAFARGGGSAARMGQSKSSSNLSSNGGSSNGAGTPDPSSHSSSSSDVLSGGFKVTVSSPGNVKRSRTLLTAVHNNKRSSPSTPIKGSPAQMQHRLAQQQHAQAQAAAAAAAAAAAEDNHEAYLPENQ